MLCTYHTAPDICRRCLLFSANDDDSDDVFIGRDLRHSKGYGENTASTIDQEVRDIVEDCYEKAKSIIKDHMEQLHASANLLMEKEKIGQEEFEALF